MNPAFIEQYPYLYSVLQLTEDSPVQYEICPAADFLLPTRFDFMAKLIYLDGLNGRYDKALADHIYTRHIQTICHGTVKEPGNPSKNGIEAFQSTFLHIYEHAGRLKKGSCLQIGFPIPLDCRSMALDGAHRICAAYEKELSIPVYRLTACQPPYTYDYRYFKSRMLEESILLYMAIKYVTVKDTTLLLLSLPRALRNERKQLTDALHVLGTPVYIASARKANFLVLLDNQTIPVETATDLCRAFCQKYSGTLASLSQREQILEILDTILTDRLAHEKKPSLRFGLKKQAWYTYSAMLRTVKKLLRRPV